MNLILVLPFYIRWHYTTALLDIKDIWVSFLLFFYNFFSIPTLFSTLFSPWMKIHDTYNINQSLLDAFVFNSLIRVFGVIVRSSFILLGVLLLLLTFAFGLGVFILWFFLPFAVFIVAYMSASLLIA